MRTPRRRRAPIGGAGALGLMALTLALMAQPTLAAAPLTPAPSAHGPGQGAGPGMLPAQSGVAPTITVTASAPAQLVGAQVYVMAQPSLRGLAVGDTFSMTTLSRSTILMGALVSRRSKAVRPKSHLRTSLLVCRLTMARLSNGDGNPHCSSGHARS